MSRICFVAPHVYGYFNDTHGLTGGGAERQIYLLSTTLAKKKKLDIHIITGDYGQPVIEQREGVTIHRAYPLRSRQSPIQPARHLTLLGHAMRRADADVYIHRGSPRNAAFVYLLSRILRSKWVYNIANDANIVKRPADLSPPINGLFRLALHDADHIIAQSKYQQHRLQEEYSIYSTVVPNGYPDSTDIYPYSQRQYFLWVGSLDEEQKRPHLYLDLAAELPETEFRLAGPIDAEKPYHNQILDRADQLPNVSLLGEVSPDEIHEHYRRAIAVINTSAYEGFPNTFLEAWRQGTPVISLTVDPQRFIDCTHCYADNQFDKLVKLTRFADDPENLHPVGTQVYNQFLQHYELNRVSEKYHSAITNALP